MSSRANGVQVGAFDPKVALRLFADDAELARFDMGPMTACVTAIDLIMAAAELDPQFTPLATALMATLGTMGASYPGNCPGGDS